MDGNKTVMDELVDEDGITIFSTFEHISLVLNTIVFGLFVFAITRGSTQEMGVYRWFLLNEVVWGFLFDWILSSFQPILIFPGPVCLFPSSRFFRGTNTDVSRSLVLFFWMTFIGKTHAFASALVHRFICAFPDYSRVARVYRLITPWLHISILVLPFAFILSFLLPFMLHDHNPYRNRAITTFPIMQEVYRIEPSVICITSPEYSTMIGLALVGLLFFICLFLLYAFLFTYTHHLLKRNEHVRALNLERILLRACGVQVLSNFIFLFIPLIVLVWFSTSRPFHSQLYITIVCLMFSLNSLSNYTCLIVFIRPYREITVNQLHLFYFKRLANSRNVTIVQSCETNV